MTAPAPLARLRPIAVRLGCALLAAGVPALSASARAESVFDGFYAGAEFGWSRFGLDVDFDAPGFGTDEIAGLDDDGLSAGLFAGYGTTFDRFYVGAEIEGGYNFTDREENASVGGVSVNAEYRVTESFGTSIRAGYLVTPQILAYARVGWRWAHLHVEGSAAGLGELSDEHGLIDGPKAGLGGEIAMTGSLFVRLDYTYTWYGDAEVKLRGPGEVKLDSGESLLRIGLVWRF